MPTRLISTICNCPVLSRMRFCGKNTVESEICFATGITAAQIASVAVTAEPANFRIELVCCDLIVVCGFIRKTVTFTPASGLAPVVVDIPVQIKVPASIAVAADLDLNDWAITGADVCAGCYNLTCPQVIGTTTVYHKLVEKDIIAVQVDRVADSTLDC